MGAMGILRSTASVTPGHTQLVWGVAAVRSWAADLLQCIGKFFCQVKIIVSN